MLARSAFSGRPAIQQLRNDPATVVQDADDDDRDVREVGVGLEGGQDGPAVHPGHQHVQGDRDRPALAGEPQALLAGGGGDDVEAFGLEVAAEQVASGRVVVDHQRVRPSGEWSVESES